MPDSSSSQGNRYDVSGNVEAQYVDTEVLVNKKGITDLYTLQIAEEKALARAYEQLFNDVRSDTLVTSALIEHVHGVIFGELYEWAGRWRTVPISKPGTSWPPPDFLDEAMDDFEQNVLRTYPVQSFGTDDAFCNALGHIQGEFLAIHPFREGNARTIKLVSDLLAVQSDRLAISYDKTEMGRQLYIDAAKAALLKNYQPMRAIIKKALEATS